MSKFLSVRRDSMKIECDPEGIRRQANRIRLPTESAHRGLEYALALSAGLVGLEAFSEFYVERKKLKCNGLSYVIDLKRELR